jgi:hypothetical protein
MTTENMWAVVTMEDGMIYEGIVKHEAPYGLYFLIGGSQDRLNLFPWHRIIRVLYKQN